jgi:hypothetical protein
MYILLHPADRQLLEDMNANRLTKEATAELAAKMEKRFGDARQILDTSIESQ